MAYTKYSLTPADNNAAPPDGAPEGMLPSAVNDTMRDMMAQIRDVGDGIRGGTYTMTAPVITGGSITGVALSGNTLTSPVITGGSINNTPIGASTANTGAFTTLSASGTTTLSANQIISVTDNSNAALRITQLGTGNALLVEDSTNPDSSPFVINASGVVLAGKTTSRVMLAGNVTPKIQVEDVNRTGYGAVVNEATTANRPSFITLGRSRGASVGSVTVVNSGDRLGELSFEGTDGTGLLQAATIYSEVDGTPGTNDMPGRLVFSTTADGASSPTERMRIGNDGGIGVGTSNASNYKLLVAGSYTGGTSYFGIASQGTFQSSVTTGGFGYRSAVGTAAAAFTLPNLYHYFATQGTFGATSTVTNQFGFHAESTLTGATNNYGFYSNIASGTGRWNFYANGTAANYFAGTVKTGSTISVGGATPSTSGAGITFPATQSASTDANTLDDYEEGTFTPTAASGFTTVSGTPAYSGTYTKIGNLVTIRIRQTTGVITWTAGANFTNLPFVPDVTVGGAGSATNGQPDYSSSVLTYRTGGGASQLYLATARATNNSDLVITATYFI
jgi:hypothetical protein